MQQDELERPGLEFTWKLGKAADGKPALAIGKAGEEPRTFSRSAE